MSLNLFIIGPSGSGKSTIGKLIAEKYKIAFFSISEVIKNEIAATSGFGDEAKMYINENKKIPDDLIFDILVNKLKSINNQNFIVSGYPKNLNQGRLVEFYLRKQNLPCTLLIHINKILDNQTAEEQKLYYDSISSIREYFETKSKFLEVDGNLSQEKIFEVIIQQIDNI